MSRAAAASAVVALAALHGGPGRVALADRSQDADRALGGHGFIPSERVPAPFVTTHIGITTGVGFARLDAPAIDEAGNPAGTTTYDLGAVSHGFQLQAAVGRLVALRASASGTALAGVNREAALVAGAELGYGLSGGALVSGRAGRFRLALSFDASYGSGYRFDPLQALIRSATAGRIDSSTLLIETDAWSLEPGVQGAVGLHPALGLWADVQYIHRFFGGDEIEAGDDSDLRAGAGLSFDARGLSRVPVGVLASYVVSIPLQDGRPLHEVGAGLLYTGRQNLLIGVEADGTRQDLDQESHLTVVTGAFRMRYYW